MTPALRRLADRLAATDPTHLAYHLLTWQLRTGGGDAELAAALGCGVGVLTPLGLCWVPRDAGEVERAEARFSLRPGSLAEICGGTY